jgi:hypothetical protein
VQDLIRKLDEQRAGHVARMHAQQVVLREDFARSRQFERRMRAAGRERIANSERRFQAEIAQQIAVVHDTLAVSAARTAELRADFVRQEAELAA